MRKMIVRYKYIGERLILALLIFIFHRILTPSGFSYQNSILDRKKNETVDHKTCDMINEKNKPQVSQQVFEKYLGKK